MGVSQNPCADLVIGNRIIPMVHARKGEIGSDNAIRAGEVADDKACAIRRLVQQFAVKVGPQVVIKARRVLVEQLGGFRPSNV